MQILLLARCFLDIVAGRFHVGVGVARLTFPDVNLVQNAGAVEHVVTPVGLVELEIGTVAQEGAVDVGGNRCGGCELK